MRAWVHRYGLLLACVALAAVVLAVIAPFVALLFGMPYLFGGVPYPAVNPMHIALAVSGVLAIVSLAAGLTVWLARAPGYHLGMATLLILGTLIVMAGGIVLTGYLMSAAHSEMRA